MADIRHFTTLDAYLSNAETPIDYLDSLSRDAHKYAEHYGTDTFSEAIALARTGWPEGSALVRQQADRFRTQVMQSQGIAQGRVIRSSPVGMAPNIPAYIAQRPDAMLTFRREPKSAPIVRIMVSIGALAGVSADAMRRRGAAVCALIDLLEHSGRRVEITMVSAVNASRGTSKGVLAACYTVLLKAAEAPLDLDRVAFALVNPAMLRHITFAARDRAPKSTRSALPSGEYGGGMGAPCDPPESIRQQYNLYVGPIVNLSDAQAEQWLITQLKAQGVLE